MKYFKKIFSIIATIVLALWIVLGVMSMQSYKCDTAEFNKFIEGKTGYTYAVDKNVAIFSTRENVEDCIIFYPGAYVDTEAYTALGVELAQNGIDCIIVDMPYKLAFFGINSADNVIKNIDSLNLGVNNYYIVGHSLGGVAASTYADKNDEKIKGLILLASYSTKDLTDNNLPILSIYGSNDGVLNLESYNDNKINISKNLTEFVIDGANHAYFGTYGMQKGDNSANISNKKQIEITAKEIINFIKNQNK